jgi:hypothetical protein
VFVDNEDYEHANDFPTEQISTPKNVCHARWMLSVKIAAMHRWRERVHDGAEWCDEAGCHFP